MIGNALRVEIERYSADIRRMNPLFTKVDDGTMTRASIARYLVNLHALLAHSPTVFFHAAARARALGDVKLAEHYEQKHGEEQGHDVWAERDIQRVSDVVPAMPSDDIVPAMNELLAYLDDMVEADPSMYLAYMFCAEYFTVILGPEWLAGLEARCGIPRSSMTAIDNHVELDKHHVEEALDCIDELVADPRKIEPMREVLRRTFDFFARIGHEVTAEREMHQHVKQRSERHVSAA